MVDPSDNSVTHVLNTTHLLGDAVTGVEKVAATDDIILDHFSRSSKLYTTLP